MWLLALLRPLMAVAARIAVVQRNPQRHIMGVLEEKVE